MNACSNRVWVKATGIVLLISTGCAFAQSQKSAGSDLAQRISRFESGLRTDIWRTGESHRTWTLQERMVHHKVPAISVAVIDNGKVAWAKAYGVANVESRTPIDTRTVFSVGSVSKVVAAAMTLRMAATSQLDLDTDVNDYLKEWKIPATQHAQGRAVTLRQILSHTSGLSVSGFPDFMPDEKLPTTIETLNGSPPSKTPAVVLQFAPGTQMLNSGGAVTVEQMIIAEVSGQSFENKAQAEVFKPLGMARSTYANPLPTSIGNIAKAHDQSGALTAKPRGYQTFPELAASGLWTTPTDIAQFVVALMKSYRGESDAFLPRSFAVDMMTEVGPSIFGLGPRLAGEGKSLRFSHGGSNDSYKAWFEGEPETGRGMVIFTNGANGEPLYQEVRRAVADAMGWPIYESISEYQSDVGDPIFGKIAGEYVLDANPGVAAKRIYVLPGIQTVKIAAGDGTDAALFLDKTSFKLIRVGPLTFVVANSYFGTPNLMRVEFIRGADGAIRELAFRQDRNAWAAPRKEQ
jgi:CubicO group peptidase (beta-lactamase class C family)